MYTSCPNQHLSGSRAVSRLSWQAIIIFTIIYNISAQIKNLNMLHLGGQDSLQDTKTAI